MIIKAKAELEKSIKTDSADITFIAYWLRVVTDETTNDFEDRNTIIKQLNQKLVDLAE